VLGNHESFEWCSELIESAESTLPQTASRTTALGLAGHLRAVTAQCELFFVIHQLDAMHGRPGLGMALQGLGRRRPQFELSTIAQLAYTKKGWRAWSAGAAARKSAVGFRISPRSRAIGVTSAAPPSCASSPGRITGTSTRSITRSTRRS
jgi:hypothetical protein